MASPIDSAAPDFPTAKLQASTIAACLVLACAMQLAENLLPKIPLFPWLKLGLSHLILLPFLLCFGAVPATALALSRSLLTWMVAGTPLTSLMVGMLAALVSLTLVGGLLRPLAHRGWIGWIGLGVASATAHNLVQLAVVEWLLVDHAGFYFQLAPLLFWSLVSGTLTALLAASALPFWQRLFSGDFALPEAGESEKNLASERMAQTGRATAFQWRAQGAFYLGLAFLGLVLFLAWWRAQLLMWTGLVTYSLWPNAFGSQTRSMGARFRTVWRATRSTWPLVLLMAWLHLFHGEGHLVGWGGVTHEGLAAFGLHALRLWNLALLGPRLLPFFPRAWLQKSSSPYAQGILIALPALAGLPAAIPSAATRFWKTWRRQGWNGFSESLNQFSTEVIQVSLKNRI
jgi:uncharacterized membrane protein